MATEEQLRSFSAVAGADLSGAANQYKFVKFSGNRTIVLCNGATDVPCGVLQNRPASGAIAQVGYLGITKVQADETLAAGDLIGTSADGQADKKAVGTDTTHYIVGQVVSGAAAGQLAEALINCGAPSRAT
jgi:hypothetical protein